MRLVKTTWGSLLGLANGSLIEKNGAVVGSGSWQQMANSAEATIPAQRVAFTQQAA